MEEEDIPSSTSSRKIAGGRTVPLGLTPEEYSELKQTIDAYHSYYASAGQCSSIMVQRVDAPADAVWSIVRRFDRPQVYKHFIKSCRLLERPATDGPPPVGSLREVTVISGLPATMSTERLDILDDDRRIFGFSITGGEHRLRNYRSVTTVNELERPAKIWTVVLESYIVDVPEGNTEEDTRMFADTVVRLNLQKLASIAQSVAKERTKQR